MDDEESQVELTPEQAISMLADNEDDIHTFVNPAGMLLGADWSRAWVIERIITAEVRHIGGPGCQCLNHGLVISDNERWVFIQCRDELDYGQFEQEVLASSLAGGAKGGE